MKYILALPLALFLTLSATAAGFSGDGFGSPGFFQSVIGTSAGDALLLVNGTDNLKLVNGTDNLCLAGSPSC